MGSKALKPLPLPSPPLAPWERTLGMLSSAWGGQGPPGVRPGLQPAPFGLCAIPSQIGAAALAPLLLDLGCTRSFWEKKQYGLSS